MCLENLPYLDPRCHDLLSCQLLNGKQNQLPIPTTHRPPSRRYRQRWDYPVVSSYKIRLFLLMCVIRWPMRYPHNWNSICDVRISSLRSNVRPTWSSSTLFHWSLLLLRKEAKLRGITVSKADPTLAMVFSPCHHDARHFTIYHRLCRPFVVDVHWIRVEIALVAVATHPIVPSANLEKNEESGDFKTPSLLELQYTPI